MTSEYGDPAGNAAIYLERRLTRIEAKIDENTRETRGVKDHVAKQNGRIGKTETYQIRQSAVGLAMLAASPFIFFALNIAYQEWRDGNDPIVVNIVEEPTPTDAGR